MSAQDLFAPPSKEELAGVQNVPADNLFAPPTKEELGDNLAVNKQLPHEQSFDWENPVSSGLLWAGKKGLENVQSVGDALNKYSAAPTRSAISSGLKGENPLSAFWSQFGEDPKKAPSGEDIAGQLHIPEKGKASPVAGWDQAFQEDELPDINPRQIAGKGIELGADVANLIPFEKGVEGLAKAGGMLKGVSESSAFKQAGAMLKDFRRANDRGKIEDLGRSLLDEVVPVASSEGKITEKPLLGLGNKVDDVAEKSAILKDDIGKKIGGIYKGIDEKVTDPTFLNNLKPDQIEKLKSAQRFDPASDVDELRKIVQDKYGKKLDGKVVVQRMNELLDEVAQRGNTLNDALALKGELDGKINYAKKTQDLPEFQRALLDTRNYIRDKTNKYVSDVADITGVSNAKDLESLNKRFGNISTIEEISTDKALRNKANRMASPTDYITSIGGLMALGPKGLLLGLGNKLARERGAGILAKGADIARKGLELSEPLSSSILQSAGSGGYAVGSGLMRDNQGTDAKPSVTPELLQQLTEKDSLKNRTSMKQDR